jgi:ribosome production factor 1
MDRKTCEPLSDTDHDTIKFDYDDSASEQFEDQDDGDWDEEPENEEDSEEVDESRVEADVSASPAIPAENLLSRIKNKLRRREMFEKQESEKRSALKKKKKRKNKNADADVPKRATRTIDNSCGFTETLAEQDSQQDDPFTCYFDREKDPKLLMTTVDHPRTKTIRFCQEFARTIPNTEFRFRKNCSIKGTMRAAHERGYTHLLVVNQDARKPNGMLMIHLPDGPTANFKLSSVKYHKDIRRHGALSSERPEIIVNNFHTRLGQTIGRFFVSLCHFDPQFKGRRVVTFHNQRDYIFFRHHRCGFS